MGYTNQKENVTIFVIMRNEHDPMLFGGGLLSLSANTPADLRYFAAPTCDSIRAKPYTRFER